jgi:hypothetical protein
VKMVVMAMGIFGALASLTACKKAPVDDTSALENPPPKPPNCPNLPELKYVTLKDGTIADVRIVQFFNTRLYIPTSWTGPYIDKQLRGLGDFYERTILETFQPNMHSVECPGVVRRFEGKSTIHFGLQLNNFARKEPSKGISADSKIEGISIWRFHPDQKEYVEPGPSTINNRMHITRDISVSFLFRGDDHVGSQRWKRDKKDIETLFAWLETPPAKRDNDQIFKLGVEGQ